jgi:SAM-dependent methyltransferase
MLTRLASTRVSHSPLGREPYPHDASTECASECASQAIAHSTREWHRLGRRLINYAERVLGWLRKSRRITPLPGLVKVNLGSGLYVAPGWINIDGSLKTALARWPRPLLRALYPLLSGSTHSREDFVTVLRGNLFVTHNLKYGVPLPAGSADFIFLSHVLHHLYKDQARALLMEIKRVLKPGGTLRVAVPDLEYIIALYLRGLREEAIEGYFFYPSASRSELSTRHYQYDFMLLTRLLESVGFISVRRCGYRQGATPDIDTLDRLPNEALFVEADKPGDTQPGLATSGGRGPR